MTDDLVTDIEVPAPEPTDEGDAESPDTDPIPENDAVSENDPAIEGDTKPDVAGE